MTLSNVLASSPLCRGELLFLYIVIGEVLTLGQGFQVDLLHLRVPGPHDFATVHVHRHGRFLAADLDDDGTLVIAVLDLFSSVGRKRNCEKRLANCIHRI